MKGVTHVFAGICAASFIPQAVQAGANGNGLYMVLAGVVALAPDTLDFKLYRYFYPTDWIIVPDPDAPDAQLIADHLARAVAQALRNESAVNVRLSTIPLPGNRWLPYTVTIDNTRHCVDVRIQDPCDTSGNPCPGSDVAPVKAHGTAVLPIPVDMIYDPTVRVDIMDGPTLRFKPTPEHRCHCDFIPWHRAWSHSIPVLGAVALVAGVVIDATAGLCVALAGGSHILLDQVGHMGSALWWPFRKQRLRGWRRAHSGDSWPNLAVVWMSVLVTGMNLLRFSPDEAMGVNPIRMLVWLGVVPLLALRVVLPKPSRS